MKILVAPLNWGLGHASRCVPLVQQWLNEGHEVVLAGDGDSLTLLRKHFPKLRYAYLVPLDLQYSRGKNQVWAMVRALPRLIRWSIQDHMMAGALLREEPFDIVVSDNRFGLFSSKRQKTKDKSVKTVYITHQLHIRLPERWRWAETVAARWHARIWHRYDEVWVPDYKEEEESLSGWLGHGVENILPSVVSRPKIQYIGPQSRFGKEEPSTKYQVSSTTYDIVAVLSGLEPQRTLLEREIINRYQGKEEQVLVVQGRPGRPMVRIRRANITSVPYMTDDELKQVLLGAGHIIARSGYSTIMDLHALGLLGKAELIPTPGQSEQEYLAEWVKKVRG